MLLEQRRTLDLKTTSFRTNGRFGVDIPLQQTDDPLDRMKVVAIMDDPFQNHTAQAKEGLSEASAASGQALGERAVDSEDSRHRLAVQLCRKQQQ